MKVGSVKKSKETITTTSSSLKIKEDDKNNRAHYNFINSIRSDNSRKTYEFTIKKYMQYYNLQDINELLTTKDNPTIIENNIIDWLVALRNTVAYDTRCTYYAILMRCASVLHY
jgi:hypothetical protein